MTYGELSLDLLKPGVASIVITLTEEDTLNGVMKDTFRVKIYEELNEKPTVDDPGILTRYIGNPTDTLYLTGITDGDDGSQLLALEFSSNDSSVILPVSATLAAVFIIATSRGYTSVTTLLLAGIALNLIFGALSSFVITLSTREFDAARVIVTWLMGDLNNRTWEPPRS